MLFIKKILRCNHVGNRFLWLSVSCYYLIVICSFISYSVFYSYFTQKDIIKKCSGNKPKSCSLKNISMKYILLWTNPNNYPFIYFGEGNAVFVNKTCKWTNCYVTGDRNFLRTYTDFDAIVFSGTELRSLLFSEGLPKTRRVNQKYVYANIESASNYPFKGNALNGFFNWTWTYKLNSDAVWGYFVVKNSSHSVIGPQEHMHWIDEEKMDPIDDNLKALLKSKTTAAAWMTSFCETLGRREEYVKALQYYLNFYNLKIDVYGDCGELKCSKTSMPHCLEIIKKTYYFYLSFENSFSEDYVTEKVLYGLNYDTIPIVYGGANYSRFLPPGSYLNAVQLGPQKLAEKMNDIIIDRAKFHRYFRWKKYYSFHSTHESPDTDVYCRFCAMVNNAVLMKEHKAWQRFNAWWMHKVIKVL